MNNEERFQVRPYEVPAGILGAPSVTQLQVSRHLIDMKKVNAAWDRSNHAYLVILERRRKIERARAIMRAVARAREPVWRRLVRYVLGDDSSS